MRPRSSAGALASGDRRRATQADGLGVRTKVVAVDGDEPELGPVAPRPLEVVEQRPVEVAAHVEAVGEAAADAFERLGHVRDAVGVVVVAEAVLGDVDRDLRVRRPRAGSRPRATAARTRSPSTRRPRRRARGPSAARSSSRCACDVRLHADEVVAARGFEELVFVHVRARVRAPSSPPSGAHQSRHRDGQSPTREVARARLQHVVRRAVRAPCRFSLTPSRTARSRARPGGKRSDQVAEHRHDVRLVDRAADRDEVAEVRDRAARRSGRSGRRSRARPSRRARPSSAGSRSDGT